MFLNSDCGWYGHKSIFSLCFDSANHERKFRAKKLTKALSVVTAHETYKLPTNFIDSNISAKQVSYVWRAPLGGWLS